MRNIGNQSVICFEMEAPGGAPHTQLMKWIMPDATAAEFFRRQGREAIQATGLPCIDAHVKLRPGHILELAGPTGSAKSDMLTQMVAHLLCSTSHIQQPEEQEHVVLIDCDGKYDVLRLLQVLKCRTPSFEALLPRFHLVRCFSSLELLLALAALPQQLAALKGRCKLLLLDNIAAHMWHDRAAAFSSFSHQLPPWHTQPQKLQQGAMQQAYGYAAAAGQPVLPPGPGFDALRVQTALAALLQGISQQWRVPVVVTKQTGVSQIDKPGGTQLVQREILAAPLQATISYRLVLMPTGLQQQQQGRTGPSELGTSVLVQWQASDGNGALQSAIVGPAGVQVTG